MVNKIMFCNQCDKQNYYYHIIMFGGHVHIVKAKIANFIYIIMIKTYNFRNNLSRKCENSLVSIS